MKSIKSRLFLLFIFNALPFISFSQNSSFSVSGKVYDTDTKKPINNATIALYGSDGTIFETKVDSQGIYYFDSTKVKENVKYTISAALNGYLTKFEKFIATGLNPIKDFIFDFDFPVEPAGCTMYFIRDDYNATFDFMSFKLSDSFKKELDDFIPVLSDNPTVAIELKGFADEKEIIKNDTLLPSKRVNAVKDYLVMKGINVKRLSCINDFSIKPFEIYRHDSNFKKGTILNHKLIETLISQDEKNKAHQLNRRVEIKVKDTNFTE